MLRPELTVAQPSTEILPHYFLSLVNYSLELNSCSIRLPPTSCLLSSTHIIHIHFPSLPRLLHTSRCPLHHYLSFLPMLSSHLPFDPSFPLKTLYFLSPLSFAFFLPFAPRSSRVLPLSPLTLNLKAFVLLSFLPLAPGHLWFSSSSPLLLPLLFIVWSFSCLPWFSPSLLPYSPTPPHLLALLISVTFWSSKSDWTEYRHFEDPDCI